MICLKYGGTLGGVPFYLEQFDSSLDYYGNVAERILNHGEVYVAEANSFSTRNSESQDYFAILRAISLGKRKLGVIIKRIRASTRAAS
jgi:hypothetical protein